jgi:RecG-like helicase
MFSCDSKDSLSCSFGRCQKCEDSFFYFAEIFYFRICLLLSRSNIRKKCKTQKHEIQKTLPTTFKNNLKFEFTKDQKKVINDIFPICKSAHPINRMLMRRCGMR